MAHLQGTLQRIDPCITKHLDRPIAPLLSRALNRDRMVKSLTLCFIHHNFFNFEKKWLKAKSWSVTNLKYVANPTKLSPWSQRVVLASSIELVTAKDAMLSSRCPFNPTKPGNWLLMRPAFGKQYQGTRTSYSSTPASLSSKETALKVSTSCQSCVVAVRYLTWLRSITAACRSHRSSSLALRSLKLCCICRSTKLFTET